MARRYGFGSLLTDLDLDVWISSERRLKTLETYLIENRGLTPDDTRTHMHRLLSAALDDFGSHYLDQMSHHLDEIVRLREILEGKWDSLLDRLDPERPVAGDLPAELQPGAFMKLFDELNKHVNALIAPHKMAESATDVPNSRTLAARDELRMALAGEGEGGPIGSEPNLLLDDPDVAAKALGEPFSERPSDLPDFLTDDPAIAVHELDFMHLPPHQRRFAAMSRLRSERHKRGTSPRDPAPTPARRAAREGFAGPERVPELEAAADIFAHFYLGEGWTVRLHRAGTYSGADLAQLEALRGLDPTFLGHGYELAIRGPGYDFRPDGVHFHEDGTGKFEFLEHKEPLGPRSESFYNSPEGRSALHDRLWRDAHIAADLPKCTGFLYSTGQPWLDIVIADLIGEIRKGNLEIGKYLTSAARR